MQAMAEMQPAGPVDPAAMAMKTFITQTWRHIEDTFCQRSWKLFLGDNVFQRLFKTIYAPLETCMQAQFERTNKCFWETFENIRIF